MRLIDADLFNKELHEYSDGLWNAEFYTADTIIGMLEDAPTVNPYEWISVEDRLPDESDQYLVTNGKIITVRMFKHPDGFTAFSKPSFCVWDNSGDGWWVKSEFPTHWMPLPSPPTEKEN